MTSLLGRVALVTGGGRGIGRAAALALADAGAKVAVVARSSDEVAEVAGLIVANGGAGAAITADVGDRLDVDRTLAEVGANLGPIDLLINNAAVVWPLGSFATIDPEEWAHAFAINVLGPVRLSRGVLPHMIDVGYGRIVNISSGAVANLSRDDTYNAYVASKAALEAHTLNLAVELDGSGVTVNALRPGIVDTAMQTYIRSQDPAVIGAGFHDRFVKRYEAGQLIAPEEPARVLIEMLESDRNGEIATTRPV